MKKKDEIEKRWIQKKPSRSVVSKMAAACGISESLAEAVASVGITHPLDAVAFLHPDYNTQICNPFKLSDMQKAVERMEVAIQKKEKILIHSDYDCDGVTTGALFKKAFALLGVTVDVFVPNRFQDGYGITTKNAERFAKKYDLVISGDTGIRAFDAAEVFKRIKKADLIVTDHHEPQIVRVGDQHKLPKNARIELYREEAIALPDCYAIVDPKRLGDESTCKSIAGVGVAFKVMHALFLYKKQNPKSLFYLLDLVATGSVADLADQISITNGNADFEVRTTIKYGLAVMNKKPDVWVEALKETAGIKNRLTSGHIGFQLGPMINAAGRLNDPRPALECLLSEKKEDALEKAKVLRTINGDRQEQTKTYEEVIKELEEGEETLTDFGITVVSDAFHIGIAGLVSSKVLDYFYRPTIALAPVEKDGKVVLKGSARSIPGVHVLHMMDEVKEKIGPYEYGGHEQAAGMTLEPERFDDFRVAFREACSKHDPSVFVPRIDYAAEVPMSDINEKWMSDLQKLEPFGQGNPKPVFRVSDVQFTNIKSMMEGRGVRMVVRQGTSVLTAVSFSLGEKFLPVYNAALKNGSYVSGDLLFQPEYNTWQGNTSIQLKIIDVKFSP